MTTKKTDIEMALNTIDKEIETLVKLRKELPLELSNVLDVLENIKGRVILTGMGKSGHIGKKIAASLASTGTPSFFIHPSEASHGDLGMITNFDVIIAISNSGEAKELLDILNYSKRFNIKLISITKNPKSTLGNFSDFILKIPNNGEACPLGLAPTNSTTATLVMGDILTTALINRKGFTENDFANRHPGGKLGSKLHKISDLMHKHNSIPLVTDNTSMDKVILEMSGKMLGCVGIIDNKKQLIGIITDGDLRRNMDKNLFSKFAKDIMTKNPKTINQDKLAIEAANIMSKNHISCLFITNNYHKPIGIIHIQDLLNKGII